MGPTPASVLLVAAAVLAPPPHAGGAPAAVRRPGEHVVARGLCDTTYPQDRATGFAVGDLRGWMWAEAPKP